MDRQTIIIVTCILVILLLLWGFLHSYNVLAKLRNTTKSALMSYCNALGAYLGMLESIPRTLNWTLTAQKDWQMLVDAERFKLMQVQLDSKHRDEELNVGSPETTISSGRSGPAQVIGVTNDVSTLFNRLGYLIRQSLNLADVGSKHPLFNPALEAYEQLKDVYDKQVAVYADLARANQAYEEARATFPYAFVAAILGFESVVIFNGAGGVPPTLPSVAMDEIWNQPVAVPTT